LDPVGELLDRDRIVQLLNEVADGLSGDQRTVILVGGAALSLRAVRDATRDIDTVTELDDEFCQVIETVAERSGLTPRFFNSNAKPWRPETLALSECETVIETPTLKVVLPANEILFLMKLNAFRPGQDLPDLVALWPLCSFATEQNAVDQFWAAYPNEPADKFLISTVREIAQRSTGSSGAPEPPS
jgi:Nucleotidyltransferase of unknown function (DUF6036)